MAVQGASKENAAGSILPETDDSMIGGRRLLLAADLFAYLGQPAEPIRATLVRMLALTGYLVYSLILLPASRSVPQLLKGRLVTGLAIACCGLLVTVTDPLDSALFLFFPFAILVSAFCRGYGEGLRVTFACARDAAVFIGAIPVQRTCR